MSRLNVNSEPTMEEILASIRRIIAEDPVDARNGFAPLRPSSAAKPALDRALFLRDAAASDAIKSAPASEARAASNVQAPSVTIEPEPAAPVEAKSDGDAHSVSQKVSRDIDDDAASADDADDSDGDVSTNAKPKPVSSQSAPITAPIAAPRQVALSDGDEPLDAEFTDITPQRGARAGFTVSRDGYIPPVAEASGNDDAADDDTADPFDFDLGPSPFTHERKPLVADVAMRSNGKAAEAPEHKPAPQAPADEASTTFSYVQYRGSPQGDVPRRRDVLETPAASPAPAAPEAPKSFAPPRVDATLPPKSEVPSFGAGHHAAEASQKPRLDSAETIARVSAAASEYVNAAGYVGRQVHQNPVMLEVLDTPGAKVHPVAVREGGPQQSTELTTEADNLPPSPRTMEDTVADLLRPMLKSWLAEHMPKIVERALRREISELDNPRQKSAAE